MPKKDYSEKLQLTGRLEIADDWLWGVWREDRFIPLKLFFREYIGKEIRITVEVFDEPVQQRG